MFGSMYSECSRWSIGIFNAFEAEIDNTTSSFKLRKNAVCIYKEIDISQVKLFDELSKTYASASFLLSI